MARGNNAAFISFLSPQRKPMTSLAPGAKNSFLINQNDFFFPPPQGITGELCCQVKVSSQLAAIEEVQQNEAEAAG